MDYTRRDFLFAMGLSAASLTATGLAREANEVAKDKRPNIIFIIADDLGWADVGYHGSEIMTPNIDRLANEGIQFEQHYVMPTCTPTRVGLISGQYPSRFGVTAPAYGKIFEYDTVTLASALRERGYHTSISGKWHMGSPPEWVPLKYGFDTSYGYFHGQIDPYTHHYKTGVRSWHRNDQFLDEQGHATDLITDEAVRIIESELHKPFFLYVAYSIPHYPLDEPIEWTSRYERQFEEPSKLWYAASVTHMDDGIGRIVDALERTGKREETLLVFVSDNGAQQSWHSDEQYNGQYADKPHKVLGDNSPLRGWKGQVYEGGIRVPALINWPGTLKKGNITAAVHIVDWMPTLCHLAGYVPDKNLNWDGLNIWPLIEGQPLKAEPRTLYWKTPNSSALRHGDWKLIVAKGHEEAELYNLAVDPYEKQNLDQQYPKRVANLKALLEEQRKRDQ